jgi:hypothetical protein
VTYQWYEDGVLLTGETGALLIIPAGKAAGTYAYWRVAANADCPTGVPSNTFTVRVNPIPTISLSDGDASQMVIQGAAITTIIYTASDAATISLSEGGFPENISGVASGSSFTISGTPSAGGTFGYSLTASNGCIGAAASGSITVMPITLCEQCCWNGDGAAWVNCHVTINAYPFGNNLPNTRVVWSGNGITYYEGASGTYTHYSDRDGRMNTANISSSTVTVNAVQICKDFGDGWYLPAYEELVNMSKGTGNEPLNDCSGAQLLDTPNGEYWSSTEKYNNGGRSSSSNTSDQNLGIRVNSVGTIYTFNKTSTGYVRCARQE